MIYLESSSSSQVKSQSRFFSEVFLLTATYSYSCPVVFSSPRRDVIRMILPLASDSAGDVRSACATALASFAPLCCDEARRPIERSMKIHQ